MASTGSVDGWPLGPTELGEAGLRVLLRLPTQASSSYTELKSSCARHDVRIRISSYTVPRVLRLSLHFLGHAVCSIQLISFVIISILCLIIGASRSEHYCERRFLLR